MISSQGFFHQNMKEWRKKNVQGRFLNFMMSSAESRLICESRFLLFVLHAFDKLFQLQEDEKKSWWSSKSVERFSEIGLVHSPTILRSIQDKKTLSWYLERLARKLRLEEIFALNQWLSRFTFDERISRGRENKRNDSHFVSR